MEVTAARRTAPRPGSRVVGALAAPGPAGWLFAGMLLVFAYAAFADGATATVAGARVQIAIGAGVAIAGAALAAGALDGSRSRLAWTGAGLLGAFAAYSAIGVTWSIAPDEGWLAANRAVAYAGVVAISLSIAPRIRAAPVALAAGLLAVALAVAAYALAGKIGPELSFGPVDLDHASQFARLREPLGYWNALGLLMVMAMPVCIWLSASRSAHLGIRTAAVVALQILIVTTALTLSRGAVLAALVAAAIMVAAGPERLGRLTALAGATALAVPPVLFAFARPTLTEDGVAAAERASDGLLLGLCLAGSMLVLAGAARIGMRFERRGGLGRTGRRRVWRGLAVAAVASVLAGAAAVETMTDRGLSGTASEQWDEFRTPSAASGDPSRLVSASSSNRYSWWREAVGAFTDRPVVGWGPGSFEVLHQLYRDDRGQVRSAHSVPLQFLAEVGAVGAALALAALAFLAAGAVRRLRRSGGGDFSARAALLAAFAAWSVHSLYDWDWEIPAVTLPALAAVAFAASGPVRPPRLAELRPDRPWRPPRTPLAAGAALIGALAIGLAALPAVAERRLADARELGAAGATEQALLQAELAERLNPVSIDALLFTANLRTEAGDTEGAERELLRAVRRQPENSVVWTQLSRAALSLGNPGVAREALEQSYLYNPAPALAAGPSLGAAAWRTAAPPELSPTALGTPPE